MGDIREAEAETATPAAPVPAPVPVDTTGTTAALTARLIAFQVLIAAGGMVTVLGFAPTSTIARIIAFLRTEEGAPVLTALITIGLAVWQWWRSRRKHLQFQALGLVLPQSAVKSPENPPEAAKKVAEAVEMAISGGQDPENPKMGGNF